MRLLGRPVGLADETVAVLLDELLLLLEDAVAGNEKGVAIGGLLLDLASSAGTVGSGRGPFSPPASQSATRDLAIVEGSTKSIRSRTRNDAV